MGMLFTRDVQELYLAKEPSVSFGGAESNVAIGLARLGVPVSWASKLGNDPFGRLIRAGISAEGVDVIASSTTRANTGFMIKERPLAGVSNVTYYRANSAASAMSPEDITEDMFEGVEILHISGASYAISDSMRKTMVHSVELAQERNITVSFDVNFRRKLWSETAARDAMRVLLPYVDILFCGPDEAEVITGEPNGDLLEILSQIIDGDVVVKDGAKGSWARIGGQDFQQDAIPVNVVDTVGAGDAFVAGFLASRFQGKSPQECLELGSYCGSFACMGAGDWESFARKEYLSLLDNSGEVSR